MNLLEPQADYGKHDTFLYALLGLAHANEELFRALAKVAMPHSEQQVYTDDPQDFDQQQIVSALLGLASLAELSGNVINAWAKEGVESAPKRESDALRFDAINDLMR